MSLITGTYRGVRKRLRGETAMLEPRPGGWAAQFDRLHHREAHGWWFFPADDFEVHVRQP
ncbi:hypothetical protein [Methylobacterium aquaticum]|uniref:Uncharacterized protein n=1 Tax=Methylobacterium aquaticum TaxID=270351 RepID=A0A0C6FTB7_9HYPH|nr:hypothetical protein [Methylobacterium aquaticum]BAQ50322.1 hypothetical protein Maq22A_3p50355 [Methylobacterium aquaticum]